MRLRNLRLLSLALALLLGQWLAVAHGFQHGALTPEQHCQLCVHGHGLDSALPVSAGHAAILPLAAEAPTLARVLPASAGPVRAYRSRAPPLFLA